MLTVGTIATFLNKFAPLELAEEWDNVGLLVGDRHLPVQRVLTCLTLTPDVADEATNNQVQLIVTHHPVLFRPTQKLTADDPQGAMLLKLIASRIAVYSPHTGYDSAADGINQQLAERLGLSEIAPLRPASRASEYAVVCYVPEGHRNAVQQALWSAGAGEIGDYSKCSFFHSGTGTFLGSDTSNPTIGQAGEFEEVAEVRLEVKVRQGQLAAALQAMCAAHPYEEPAYFVHPLAESPVRKPRGDAEGTGRCGRFDEHNGAGTPATLADFLLAVKEKLGIRLIAHSGDLTQAVTKVAIACGSGAELLRDALQQGCNVFLTGEARFHSFLEASSAAAALVSIGHYASERPALEQLAHFLGEQFPEIHAWASRNERDPVQWF